MKIIFNPDPDEMLRQKARKIVFVHVGKCAGESIMHILRQYLDDSFVMFEMHCFDSNTRLRDYVEQDNGDTEYIIAKREPVSRFISAFNWDKHNQFMSGKLKGSEYEEFFQVFHSVSDLISGMQSSDIKTSELAYKMARFGHMGMGQFWYTPPTLLRKIMKKPVYFTDTSSLAGDLSFILGALTPGVNIKDVEIPKLKAGFSDGYSKPEKLFPSSINEKDREFLTRYLQEDMRVYKMMV